MSALNPQPVSDYKVEPLLLRDAPPSINISGLLAATTYTSDVFDLGADWGKFSLLALECKITASIGSTLEIYPTDIAGTRNDVYFTKAFLSGSSTYAAPSGYVNDLFRPTSRYFRVKFVNGATNQAADSQIRVTALS